MQKAKRKTDHWTPEYRRQRIAAAQESLSHDQQRRREKLKALEIKAMRWLLDFGFSSAKILYAYFGLSGRDLTSLRKRGLIFSEKAILRTQTRKTRHGRQTQMVTMWLLTRAGAAFVRNGKSDKTRHQLQIDLPDQLRHSLGAQLTTLAVIGFVEFEGFFTEVYRPKNLFLLDKDTREACFGDDVPSESKAKKSKRIAGASLPDALVLAKHEGNALGHNFESRGFEGEFLKANQRGVAIEFERSAKSTAEIERFTKKVLIMSRHLKVVLFTETRKHLDSLLAQMEATGSFHHSMIEYWCLEEEPNLFELL